MMYLRDDLCWELLAEVFGVSRPAASRAIAAYAPLIAQVVEAHVPTVRI